MTRSTILTYIRQLQRLRVQFRLDKSAQVEQFAQLYISRLPSDWTDEQKQQEAEWVSDMLDREYPPAI